MAESQHLKNLIAFIQKKGFIYGPEPEIYGGLAGFYTYGPMGKLLKNQVENAIRSVFMKADFFEVEAPTVMQAKVWEASGHLGGFTDPLIKCGKCNATFRVDNLIEELLPGTQTEGKTNDQLLEIINEQNLKCTSCQSEFKKEILNHSLMMRTTIGVDTEAYNRPETATTTYLPFQRYTEFFRDKFPFGVFQIGKAYRNEISPRQHVIRGREFTQAEGQLFIFEEQKNDFAKFENVKTVALPIWSESAQKNKKEPELISVGDLVKKKVVKSQAYAWTLHLTYDLYISMGIPKERIRFRQHHDDEKAFYADDAWDLELKTESFGWIECCGIHDRTDYDLKQHSKFSGKELMARNEKNEKVYPHVLEIAFGTDRPTFALLDIFYDQKNTEEGKTTFQIPYHLAPIKIAVLPLLNKDGIPEFAQEVLAGLRNEFMCVYDRSGSIGKRYLRNNEMGIPYSITIDHDSLTNKDVTIRDRDSGDQVRVKVDELRKTISGLLALDVMFDSLK